MKDLHYTLLFFVVSISLSAQPAIQWQKCFGGTANDSPRSIAQTTDGGLIAAGFSTSNNGDVIGNHGGGDWWVIKIDATGNLQWQRPIGGSSTETAFSIKQTIDGGYIAAGRTYSNNGDVSGNHGDWDYWVVKLNSGGIIEWQKTFGGTKTDEAFSICQTLDQGYVVAGNSASADGDVSINYGYLDIWIVKMNLIGEIQWEKSYGGSTGADIAYNIIQTNDGGYFVTGTTNSFDGDVIGQHGNDDCWVLKLDSLGHLEWQRALGGFASDVGVAAKQTNDGGYIVAALAGSHDGDVSGWHGYYDYWIIKLSSSGEIEWQKALGGSDFDAAQSICVTSNNNYVVCGVTHSIDGDVGDNDGFNDSWIVKLDSVGEILWQKSLGGTGSETASEIIQTSDGGFAFTGETGSNDGDVSGNHGGIDFWVVKLSAELSPTTEASTEPMDIYPNPATQSLSVSIPSETSSFDVIVSDLLGREVLRQAQFSNGGSLQIVQLPTGIYAVKAVEPSGKTFVGKFKKE